MMPHSFNEYEQAKTHHQQLQQASELARRAKEATADSTRAGPLAEGAWEGHAALASSHTPLPKKAPARKCQRSAASALNHSCAQPGSTRHLHEGARAEHIPCH